LELIPANTHPMDMMRTACSMLGTLEPESETPKDIYERYNQYDVADRLIALFGPIMLYWKHYHESGIRIETVTKPTDTIAENFVKLLYNDGKDPDPVIVRAVDVTLILYAEHEFAASTFACRITISTMADLYSGICTAIGTLRGPLHGKQILKMNLKFRRSK
jgi:2-methylcitrate synthase